MIDLCVQKPSYYSFWGVQPELSGRHKLTKTAEPSTVLLDIHAEVLGSCAVGVTLSGQAQPS